MQLDPNKSNDSTHAQDVSKDALGFDVEKMAREVDAMQVFSRVNRAISKVSGHGLEPSIVLLGHDELHSLLMHKGRGAMISIRNDGSFQMLGLPVASVRVQNHISVGVEP